MGELGHDGFHAGWIAGRVGCLQEHTVEPFVIRTHTQALARRPFCSTSIESLQATLGKPARHVDDDGFDCRQDPFKDHPVR